MLQRVERHIITKENQNYKQIDYLCFMSKNLYNYTNYILRQSFIHTGKLPNENDLIKKFRTRNNFDYYNLSGNINQQCVKQVYQNWKSFFKVVKAYKNNKTSFNGKPKLPNYKNKNGRNILIFTHNDARIKDGYLYVNHKTSILPIKTNITNSELKQVRIIPQTNCYIIEDRKSVV